MLKQCLGHWLQVQHFQRFAFVPVSKALGLSLLASVQIWINAVAASRVAAVQNQPKWAQHQTEKVTLVSLSKINFFWLPFRFGP